MKGRAKGQSEMQKDTNADVEEAEARMEPVERDSTRKLVREMYWLEEEVVIRTL